MPWHWWGCLPTAARPTRWLPTKRRSSSAGARWSNRLVLLLNPDPKPPVDLQPQAPIEPGPDIRHSRQFCFGEWMMFAALAAADLGYARATRDAPLESEGLVFSGLV